MSVMRPLALALLLAGSLAGPVAAQDPTAVTVTGTVRNERGRPVARARVVTEGAADRTALTDANGAYRLGPLAPGTYRVRVEAFGYRADPRELMVATGMEPVSFVLEAAPIALAPIQVVSAVRTGTGTTAATLPLKVQVVGNEEIQLQQSLVSSPTEMLTNLIPSFSPARQKLSSAGESFRGRRPLFLVDGVPQSNPLRDGQREGFTIDPEVVERIEVVFGANAIQGLGATGGIVNYVTVEPSSTGETQQRISLATTSNDALNGDGFGWRGHYLAAKRVGSFDLLGSASYERRGLQFDAEDRSIALDNTQGDVADSWSRNLLAKVGWDVAADQRVQLMVNDFRLEQLGGFDIVVGDRAAGRPAVSIEGKPEGTEPINDVTTASLDYEHRALAGGTLATKVYWQDFSALYGGGRFATFQDPSIAPVGQLFDQSENNSEKVGTRLTFARSDLASAPLDVIAGFDFLRDRTFQRLVQTGRNWVPEATFRNYAPFAQLDARPFGWLSLSGGVRWELAELDVPDFTTLAGNRRDLRPVTVEGGSPTFDQPLLNVGGVLSPLDGLRLYATFAQAYTMPDVGRVLRGVSQEGTAVEDFLDLSPIETDNREVGAAFATAWGRIGATWFESESELGSRLVANSDGIFQVVREPVRTSGWELSGRLEPSTRLAFDAGYSRLDGRFDGNADGEYESDLSAADIGPDRLNLSADINRGGTLSGRIQAFRFFDETFRNANGDATARFDGYHTVDASIGLALRNSNLTLSAANVLDAQYITYYSQAATTLNDRYFAGRGRTLTLRVETRL